MNTSWLDEDMYERYFPRHEMNFVGTQGVVILIIAPLGLIDILTYSLEKRT